MRLSNKSTFSLVCFILILAFAFAAMPAMAQVTIEATWSTDRNNDNTADDPGWRVTLNGLANNDVVTVEYLDVNGTAAAATGTQTGFDAVAADATTTEGQIEAALGTQIAVQVSAGASGAQVLYQRVTFPVAGPNTATLAATTLVRLPKLTKLTTPNYYVNFANNMATIMFNFEAAEMDSHGEPSAPLHVSDVTTDPAASWQVVSVSGTNMVTVRATHATGATSEPTIVSLGTDYAQAATAASPVNVPGNGTARVIFDDTAPTATVPAADGTATPPVPFPLRAVSLSTDFAAPEVDEDTVWDEDFYLRVLINDDPDSGDATGRGVDFVADMISFDKMGMLEVVQVGMDANQAGQVEADTNDAVYLVHIRLLPDRVTTAGEEVVIIITPVDRSGNAATAPARQTVKLAEMAAPTVQPNRAPTFAQGASISDITATVGTAIANVTLPVATDPDNDTLTYTIANLPAGLTLNSSTRVLSGTPTAMSAQAEYTYTASDGNSSTADATLMFMITVNAAPSLDEVATETNSAVITIQPQSFVVVVRADDDTVKGLQFRDDVTVVEWSTMPDLERLFYRGTQGVILGNGGGGALILNESITQSKDRRVGSVGISEIMWGVDKGFLGNESKEKAVQWIELHNLNAIVEAVADDPETDADETVEGDDGVAKVYLSWKTGRDITSDSTLTGNLANPTLDVVTNFFNNRPGHAAWDVKGSSGDSVTGEDFKSMGRILPDKKSAYANADGARYDNRDGRAAGHWNASSSAYLTARTSETDTAVVYQYVGTPGRVNNVSVDVQPDSHCRSHKSCDG